MDTLTIKDINPNDYRIFADGNRLFTVDNLRSAMKTLNFDAEQIGNVVDTLSKL